MKADITTRTTDVLCFVETFVGEEQKLDYNAQLRPEMKCFRAERPHFANLDKGGIMIMAPPEMTPTIPNPDNKSIEHRTVMVTTQSKIEINIVTVYRSPTTGSPLFMVKL